MKACKLDKPCSQWLPRESPRLRTATGLLRETEVDSGGYCFGLFACRHDPRVKGGNQCALPHPVSLVPATSQACPVPKTSLYISISHSCHCIFDRVAFSRSIALTGPPAWHPRTCNSELKIRS